jgi:citrate lyase beta subunit
MLKLFYITNKPEVALVAEKNGVDRIWIDLEKNGKAERQKGINAVQSDHSVADIEKIKPLLTKSEMLVRINPWFEGSEDEVEQVVNAGADLIMLPMWKSADEVKKFLSCVNGRAKTVLLLETKEAVECIDEVLELSFDEIHIGLNDLHISYGMDFMFEPLANGMVDELCAKFRQKGVPYGFGGIARLGKGLLKAEKVIMEHYRLGSTWAIYQEAFAILINAIILKRLKAVF